MTGSRSWPANRASASSSGAGAARTSPIDSQGVAEAVRGVSVDGPDPVHGESAGRVYRRPSRLRRRTGSLRWSRPRSRRPRWSMIHPRRPLHRMPPPHTAPRACSAGAPPSACRRSGAEGSAMRLIERALALAPVCAACAQDAMRGLDLNSADMTTAEMTSAQVEAALRAGHGGRGADFAGKRLSGLDLSGLDLSGANFRAARLNHANLSDAKLTGATLDQAWALDADHTGANLAGRAFSRRRGRARVSTAPILGGARDRRSHWRASRRRSFRRRGLQRR
jgi:hypothetical protein